MLWDCIISHTDIVTAFTIRSIVQYCRFYSHSQEFLLSRKPNSIDSLLAGTSLQQRSTPHHSAKAAKSYKKDVSFAA